MFLANTLVSDHALNFWLSFRSEIQKQHTIHCRLQFSVSILFCRLDFVLRYETNILVGRYEVFIV